MRRNRRWAATAMAALAALTLGACASAPSEDAPDAENEPASVEPIKGTDLSRVTLTPQAAQRVGIATAPIRGGAGGEVIPTAAVLYDAEGAAYTYTNPLPRVYVRAPLVLRAVEGERAVLAEGPPVGTRVVTVGATELYGVEFGVEED